MNGFLKNICRHADYNETNKIHNTMRKRILYRIVVETNGWIARRDPMFKPHHTKAVIESGLTFKEAKEMLLDMFNAKFEWEIGYAPNWGIAVIKTKKFADGANKTHRDGTRSFNWDSRVFSIEEMEEE